jgi:serine/threonine protein kinase
LINFVPRDAIVLERIELPLAEFASARRQYLHRLLTAKGLSIGTPQRGATTSSMGERVSGWFAGKNDPTRVVAIAHKVLLLEKVRIVVQLAETLAWLHGQKDVVHKDLALDNVMVRVAPLSANDEAWRGEQRPVVTAGDLLNDLASCHSFRAVLIDFGLSDTSIPTRAWYDDAAATGQNKEPFLSPEAKDRKVQINLTQRLIFSPAEKTFEIPPELQGMLREGDTIVDRQDPDHRFEFRVEQVQGTRATYSYSYEAPERRDFRQIVLEQPLLEPHDVFALGALFYYLLTERFVVSRGNGELRGLDQDLRGLLRELESHGTPVEKGTMQREGLYREVRSAIYAPAWHDDLMLIILRAMTRGLPHSYARNRIHRGPEPAQQFLLEVKRLHNEIQRDIVSSW